MKPLATVALFCAISGLLVGKAGAQVPDGWYVISALRLNASGAPGGLFVGHSVSPGVYAAVTGLGPDLSPPGPGTTISHGANCVLLRPDGVLVVGEGALPGTPLDLHLITLNGFAVASDTLINVGTAATFTTAAGQIAQAALRPNGDILIAVNGVMPGGPVSNPGIGLVTPGGAVSNLPIPLPALDTVNALTVDPTGSTIYYGIVVSGSLSSSPIYTVPFPGGPAPVLVASVPGMISGLRVEAATGNLIASTFSGLYRVNPATGAVTTITDVAGGPNAVVIEQATAGFLMANAATGTNAKHVLRISGAGLPSPLTASPGAVWGVPTGIDLNPTPRTFGDASPGQNSYEWSLDLHPGGLPTLGNASFSLTIASSPGCAAGIAAVSLGVLPTPLVAGTVQIYVDPWQLVLTANLPCAPLLTMPVPIPNVASLAGIRFYLQAAYWDPAGGAATRGLMVTIL